LPWLPNCAPAFTPVVSSGGSSSSSIHSDFNFAAHLFFCAFRFSLFFFFASLHSFRTHFFSSGFKD
jgi:hypothetical protein